MAGLLVSVRSADEALAAVRGGAAVVDVKEPANGPLGRADPEVWAAVRAAVPSQIPVSIALGELTEWIEPHGSAVAIDFDALLDATACIAYRKVGLAGAAALGDWAAAWSALRSRWQGPPWIAVIYVDFVAAGAPEPWQVLEVALQIPDCVGVLLDTWQKSVASIVDESWFPIVSRAKAAGRLVAVAGMLDAAAIRRLLPVGPDLFGVRSAACFDGDRMASIDPIRVADLAWAAGLGPRGRSDSTPSNGSDGITR